jgi:DegV family protein with EDD domain
MTIHIITDSTSDLDAERAQQYGITVVPQYVIFGNQSFLDGVEIDYATFYQKLKSSPVLPTTAMPTADQMELAYRHAISDGATGIISIHISAGLSGTINSATLAARAVTADTGIPIEVVDSRGVNVMIAVPAISAAERARTGASMADLLALIGHMIDHAHLYALLDTLEYLERGGRIGKASALLGSLLNIKPILTITDGRVTPLERIRTRYKALLRIEELLRAHDDVDVVAIASSGPEGIAAMRTIVTRVFPDKPITVFGLGSVVGTHAGPGAACIYVTSTK